MMLAQSDPWRWQPHPEVWVLLLGVLGLAFFVTRRIGPNALPEGVRPVSRRQAVWFWLGFAGLWIASDWPMHDIAEEYLYSVHMVQHLLLTFVVPPLLLMATPTWLAELLLGNGLVHKWMKRLTHPVVAGVAFNAVQIVTHWQLVVNTSVDSGPFHYGVHTLVFTTSLLMWMPVLGPAPEFHISKPAQMVYLFFMTLVPTVPAAWLTFAEGVLYENYDNSYRLFGVTATHDQQYAGVVMKIVAGTYLWVLIATMFFRWASKLQSDDQQGRFDRSSGDWDAAAIDEIGTDTPVG